MPKISANPTPIHAPIRAVIVDDSEGLRNLVSMYIERYFSERISIVGEGEDVEDSVAVIRRTRPQLLFLDIELRTGTGFEVLDIVANEREELIVILITKFDQYAKKALLYGVLEYIEKPIMADEFKRGVERSIKKVLDREAAELHLLANARAAWEANPTQDTPSLLAKIKEGDEAFIHVRLSGLHGTTVVIAVREITHCVAFGGYTHIYRHEQPRCMDSRPLVRYEEKLAQHGFVRVSRSLLVNPLHCRFLVEGEKEVIVILPDGTRHIIDGTYREPILAYLRQFRE